MPAPILARGDGLIKSTSTEDVVSTLWPRQACLVATPTPDRCRQRRPCKRVEKSRVESSIALSSVPVGVAEVYRYVVGVDTHAASHSSAVLAASTGALVDEATFPTSSAGIARARGWIERRSRGDPSAVLIAVEGTGSYGAVLGDVLAAHGYRVVEAPSAKRDRGARKTDTISPRRLRPQVPPQTPAPPVTKPTGAIPAQYSGA